MTRRLTTVLLFSVIAFACIGYAVGIRDGDSQPDSSPVAPATTQVHHETASEDFQLIPAISYAEMADVRMGPTKAWQSKHQTLPEAQYSLFASVELDEAAKFESSQLRASRRAYNGAPPVIPHPVENTNDAACYACHSQGVRIALGKASVMSHPFLANCQQCHAPMAPAPFRHVEAAAPSNFVGIPAPKQGKRAYPGAPPTIPHSQWMRENCNACHGGPHGWPGMETTHPWRTNCTQCHAPSATLDQMPMITTRLILPSPDIVEN